jgi:hypothetical protein
MVDQWERFGRAVRNSSTLHDLVMRIFVRGANVEYVAAASRCIRAFFAEVNHNNSIEKVNLVPTGLLANAWVSLY